MTVRPISAQEAAWPARALRPPNADVYARRSPAAEIRASTARRRSRATMVVDPSLIVS